MRSILPLCVLLAGVLLVPALPAPAHAQAGADLRGTWVLDMEASDDIEAAIRDYTGNMNRITALFARRLIRNTNQPWEWVRIDHGPARVSITTPGREPIVRAPDGEAQPWVRPEDRRTSDVSMRWRNDRLVQVFENEDGRRENVFSLGRDGRTLNMDVTLTSPRRDLPDPMSYRLVFRRR